MKHSFKAKYEILDQVFHITADCPKGVIIDIEYSIVYGITYIVAFHYTEGIRCKEHELSTEKTII